MMLKKMRMYFLMPVLMLVSGTVFAQEPPKEKTPQEYAAMETDRLEKELNLNSHQVFYVDSVLQQNLAGVMEEFEQMRKAGMQDSRSYETVRNKWTEKSLAAFKFILTEQQYIQYLKLIGKGKEYKKGKDGLYYKKEDKKAKQS